MNKYRLVCVDNNDYWHIIRIDNKEIVAEGTDYQILIDALNMINNRRVYNLRFQSVEIAKRIIGGED